MRILFMGTPDLALASLRRQGADGQEVCRGFTQPDKRQVVREALRVIKKGGSFAFHDLFEQKQLYGDMDEFLEFLRREGIREIHYEAHTERLPMVPWFAKAPWMLTGLGLIYGRK